MHPSAPPRSVLVVEDDEHIAHLLKFILAREKFEVRWESDGRAAQAAIESGPAPSLVLLDVLLPSVDGFELLALLRGLDGWKEVPVIMLTGGTREADAARAIEAGANDYVRKPFKPDELLSRIRKHLPQG